MSLLAGWPTFTWKSGDGGSPATNPVVWVSAQRWARRLPEVKVDINVRNMRSRLPLFRRERGRMGHPSFIFDLEFHFN